MYRLIMKKCVRASAKLFPYLVMSNVNKYNPHFKNQNHAIEITYFSFLKHRFLV